MSKSFQNEVPPSRINIKLDLHTGGAQKKVDSVLSDFNPKANLTVKNTLSPAGGEMNVNLDFKSMRDFHPEQIAQNVPELRALLAMRNLLRDLKSNLLDDSAFRRELEAILRDENLSAELRDRLEKIAPINNK